MNSTPEPTWNVPPAGLRPTCIEIDLDALIHNYQQVRQFLPQQKILAIVKADAYGHGSIPVAQALAAAGVEGFGVVSLDEAVQLRLAGIQTPILNMGEILPSLAEYAVHYDVQQMVFRPEMCQALSTAAAGMGKTAQVHFKIDTGMSRYGARWDQALVEFEKCNRYSHLQWVGVMTHFPMSDELDKSFALLQIMRMQQLAQSFSDHGYHIPLWHMCNSGGLLDLPDARMNMVRCGILLYGIYPSKAVQKPLALRPVMTLKTHIVAIKELQRGATVGYGRRYTAQGPERIAVLPIGYADGYDRKLRNIGRVLLHGRQAPIIGGLCMDACFIHIGAIPEARIGDPVILMGRDGNEIITPHDIADLIGSVSYEVIARFGKRIPRVYYQNGKILP
jgi:alanine racemase